MNDCNLLDWNFINSLTSSQLEISTYATEIDIDLGLDSQEDNIIKIKSKHIKIFD